MATVELRELCKSFGTYLALESLNLTIEDGEFLVLLGPSGCGKSTTMRLIAGLEEATSGDIMIAGRRVNNIAARHRNLAMVFQNYALYPHMTVGENIAYPLKIQGLSRAERQSRVEEAAATVELSHLLTRRPAELSGGQRQRVALARAVVRRPQLFLMDEPLSNLDAKLRTVMRAELKHLQKSLGTTTIYVTHDQVEAMTLADRIVVLNNATIQQVGTPKQIYNHPENIFVASFIGSPPMNLLKGHISAGLFQHTHGAIPLAQQDNGEVYLGIRPEDIYLVNDDSPCLEGVVYSSELLGDCILLNVTCGETLVSVKVGVHEDRNMGESIKLGFNPEKIHVFNRNTGKIRI